MDLLIIDFLNLLIGFLFMHLFIVNLSFSILSDDLSLNLIKLNHKNGFIRVHFVIIVVNYIINTFNQLIHLYSMIFIYLINLLNHFNQFTLFIKHFNHHYKTI
jgi:hypothetical protein